jgi:hypothetical protein
MKYYECEFCEYKATKLRRFKKHCKSKLHVENTRYDKLLNNESDYYDDPFIIDWSSKKMNHITGSYICSVCMEKSANAIDREKHFTL